MKRAAALAVMLALMGGEVAAKVPPDLLCSARMPGGSYSLLWWTGTGETWFRIERTQARQIPPCGVRPGAMTTEGTGGQRRLVFTFKAHDCPEYGPADLSAPHKITVVAYPEQGGRMVMFVPREIGAGECWESRLEPEAETAAERGAPVPGAAP